jgi:hypothetical protein
MADHWKDRDERKLAKYVEEWLQHENYSVTDSGIPGYNPDSQFQENRACVRHRSSFYSISYR